MILLGSIGIFISPEGEICLNKGSHIQAVICNPVKFGLTLNEIHAEYHKFSEPIGLEGKAREVLLKKVIQNGWIRLRRYPNRQWSITVYRLDCKTISFLQTWARAILNGLSGAKEADLHMPIVITNLQDGKISTSTVGALSQDAK